MATEAAQLAALSMNLLRERAQNAGATAAQLEAAANDDVPKQAYIAIIVAHENHGGITDLRRELAGLSMKELCARAKAAGATGSCGWCHAQCQPVRFAMTVVARCLEHTYNGS